MKTTITLIGALFVALMLAAIAGQESIADTQDEQAISSRDWAANKVCEGRAFEWQGDVLICYKEKP